MTLPEFPPAFYVVAVIAILVTGIAKGGFGQGSGGIAVPLMAMFIAPQEAAGIMLPILCAMDLFSVHAYRRAWSREHVRSSCRERCSASRSAVSRSGCCPSTRSAAAGVIAVTFALNQWLRFTERIAERVVATRGKPGRVAGAVLGHRLRLHQHARARRRSALRDLHAGPEGRQDALRGHVGRLLPDRQLREA